MAARVAFSFGDRRLTGVGIECGQDPVRSGGGLEVTRQQLCAHLVTQPRDTRRASKPLLELVAHQRPREVQLLLRPLALETLGPERLAVVEHRPPDLQDAFSRQPGAREHGWDPLLRAVATPP